MWNERYNSPDYIYGTEPNAFLREHFAHIPAGGKVLCLAEGEGRNAVFLAQQGYAVTAVDLSEVGLAKAKALATARGVSITCLHADLGEFDMSERAWDGIVSIFCHLPPAPRQRLYCRVAAALTRSGVFLLESYTPDQLAFATGGPRDVNMLVDTKTLQTELIGLKFSLLEERKREVVEGSFHTGLAAVVQAIASPL